MIRLECLGADSRLHSSLCAECPQGPAGCCKAPPFVDFSDIGRIVAGGGLDFLLERIRLEHLIPAERGLRIRRVRKREEPTHPREQKCVFHGAGGCTIDARLRPATCNYFLCEDAFVLGAKENAETGARAREAHAALREHYERWDAALWERIRVTYPAGFVWDAEFLSWLGAAFGEMAAGEGAVSGDEGAFVFALG